MNETELVERLGDLDVGDRVRVTLEDGTAFEGAANPIDYVPEDSLRVEVRSEDGPADRYEIRAEYDGEWGELRVRSADVDAENTRWKSIGVVEQVETADD